MVEALLIDKQCAYTGLACKDSTLDRPLLIRVVHESKYISIKKLFCIYDK